MQWVDTHFHVRPDTPLAEQWHEAREQGVIWGLVAGAAIGYTETMLRRIGEYDTIYGAVGVHPHQAADFDGHLEPYRRWAAQEQVRAIGETGLDYYYNKAPADRQRQAFAAQLELAAELGLPPIIHCRDAYDDCEKVLADHFPAGRPFVVHCFTGTPEWALRFVGMGGSVSFSGILTFPNADEVRAALKVVPPERLLFETDAPYLAPVPKRGKPNQPANVQWTVRFAAEQLEVEPETLAASYLTNASALFNVPRGGF